MVAHLNGNFICVFPVFSQNTASKYWVTQVLPSIMYYGASCFHGSCDIGTSDTVDHVQPMKG